MNYLIEPRRRTATIPTCSARGDASQIAMAHGYQPLYIQSAAGKGISQKILNNIARMGDALQLARKVSSRDTVFMQWPTSMGRVFPLFLHWLRKTRPHLVVLVHDIDILRGMGGGKSFEQSLSLFSVASKIILHSDAMKQFVVQHGIEASKIAILQCFDYLTHDEITRPPENSDKVVFVGQLDKSAFLEKLTPAKLDFHLNLYGRFEKDLGASVTYKSTFRSDNVSIFEGSWGLVWNGDTIDECTGAMGDYLRYNAPHKVSLYVAAQLPIIIWDKAAKADYVREQGIGICVSSLREIGARIRSVTDEQYKTMIANIKRESQKVRTGQQLLSCLG